MAKQEGGVYNFFPEPFISKLAFEKKYFFIHRKLWTKLETLTLSNSILILYIGQKSILHPIALSTKITVLQRYKEIFQMVQTLLQFMHSYNYLH